MSNLATFTTALNTQTTNLATAKTVYSDSSNTTKIFTAGANGSLVKRIRSASRATISTDPVLVFLYRSKDTAGTTLYEIPGMSVPVATRSATVAAPAADANYTATNLLRLEPGEFLFAAISKAANIDIEVEGEDF